MCHEDLWVVGASVVTHTDTRGPHLLHAATPSTQPAWELQLAHLAGPTIGTRQTLRWNLERVQAFCDHRLVADRSQVWDTERSTTRRTSDIGRGGGHGPCPVRTLSSARKSGVMAAHTSAQTRAGKLIAHHAQALEAQITC